MQFLYQNFHSLNDDDRHLLPFLRTWNYLHVYIRISNAIECLHRSNEPNLTISFTVLLSEIFNLLLFDKQILNDNILALMTWASPQYQLHVLVDRVANIILKLRKLICRCKNSFLHFIWGRHFILWVSFGNKWIVKVSRILLHSLLSKKLPQTVLKLIP